MLLFVGCFFFGGGGGGAPLLNSSPNSTLFILSNLGFGVFHSCPV